ncbi:MAG TPA: alpha/beta fold hydrolase [Burkholderiaceae bacterium]
MKMSHLRSGRGKPLLLIHGLGGSASSWSGIREPLAARHEVIAVDLPGFGATPPLPGETSIRTLCDAVTSFIDAQGLRGVDAVGSSMGARLVLELARRGGVVGSVVSLDPGGFWRGWERHAFFSSIWLSIRAVRMLQPLMPAIVGNTLARTLLLAQFSRRPWALEPAVVLEEMRSYARASAFDELLRQLAYGEEQQGASPGSIHAPLVIGWGRQDRICFPRQAKRALSLFPDARLHWFERCGHFPHWDAPQETVQLILDTVAGRVAPSASATRSFQTVSLPPLEPAPGIVGS